MDIPADLLSLICQFLLTDLRVWRTAYGVSQYWKQVIKTKPLVYAYMALRVGLMRIYQLRVRDDITSGDIVHKLSKHMPLIGHLDISRTYVQDIELRRLSVFSSLTSLNLSGLRFINFYTMKAVSNLISLQELHLQGCSQLPQIESVTRLTRLKILDLTGCSNVHDLTPLMISSSGLV